MRDRLGIGVADELVPRFGKLLAQLAEILDDAVVDDCHQVGCMRMCIVFGRTPVRRPARMTNADGAAERLLREPGFERAQLALRTPAAAARRDRAWRRPPSRSRGTQAA